MKRYVIIIFTLISITYNGCKKDDFNYPEGYIGISKITVFPTITVKGNKYATVVLGSNYTDAGATATAGTKNVDVKVSGLPTTNKAGVYRITYFATNEDGFSAKDYRTVVVYDTKADAVNNDFSGKYKRVGFDVISTWSKLAPGVYLVNNPGGAPSGTNINVIAINPTGAVISIPTQETESGAWGSESETKDLTTQNYSWKVINNSYGRGLRSFIKQ